MSRVFLDLKHEYRQAEGSCPPNCQECFPEKRVSGRERARRLLSDGKTRTCMEILHQLGDFTSSDSLSSSLLQMVKKGELEAVPKFGPRGGRGYRMAKKKGKKSK